MLSNLFSIGSSNFIIKALKSLTFLLDKIIYSFVNAVYQIFYSLANARLIGDDLIRNITDRVYILLGIIMVFVLAFNLLNYIVDPDKITDKKVGATAFVKDVLIALAIISMAPLLFNKLYALQSKILSSGVIANLILGGNSSESVEYDTDKYSSLTEYYIANGANTMIASTYVAFLYPKDGNTALSCGNTSLIGSDEEAGEETSDDSGEENSDFQAYCDAYTYVKEGASLDAFADFINNEDYNYPVFLTTVAGIGLLFFMLVFCINLAKRAAKLGIIQLVAPVSVTLELIPTQKGVRKKWFDTLVKVYLEVFMYLLTMYLTVFLISLIPGVIAKLFENQTDLDGLIPLVTVVLLIFGLLMFAKEAPDFISELLGIKTTGTLKAAFNDSKKALAWGTVGAGIVGGSVGRLSRNVAATYQNNYDKYKKSLHYTKGAGGFKNFAAGTGAFLGAGFTGLASGIGGVGSGTARQLWGARKVNSISDARNLQRTTNDQLTAARMRRDANQNAYGGAFGALGHRAQDTGRSAVSGAQRYFGIGGGYQGKKNTEAVMREYKKLYGELEGLYKSDNQYQAYQAERNRALAIGDNATAETIKRQMEARQWEVLREKKLEFMEVAGKLNNFADANQGVKGIYAEHINLDDIAKISNDNDAEFLFTGIKGNVKTEGFEKVLDNLKADTPYQNQRLEEKLREDARKAAAEAANKASSNNNNKK